MWYDKWGQKCLPCQEAVNKKIIPGSICFNDKVWYSKWNLEHFFKLKSPQITKLFKSGVLKARVVPATGFRVYMIKDNKGVLPPKELLQSRSVQVAESTYRMDSWYEYLDPKEVLKDYEILQYLPDLKKSGD